MVSFYHPLCTRGQRPIHLILEDFSITGGLLVANYRLTTDYRLPTTDYVLPSSFFSSSLASFGFALPLLPFIT